MRAVGWEEDTLDPQEGDDTQEATGGDVASVEHEVQAEKRFSRFPSSRRDVQEEKAGDMEMMGVSREVENPLQTEKDLV